MRKCILVIISCFFASYIWPQSIDFKKTIEHKYSSIGLAVDETGVEQKVETANVESKNVWEKRLFGLTNAEIEFSVVPSFAEAYGLRLQKDKDSVFQLEVLRISNWNEIEELMRQKYPIVNIPSELTNSPLYEDVVKIINKHNTKMYNNQTKEKENMDLYEVTATSVSVSDRFAKKLYTKIITFIMDFKGGDMPVGALVVGDGEYVTFRGIADNDVWTLLISNSGFTDEAYMLSGLCKKIINDIEAGGFDEEKYLKELKNN